ncbi:MAG: glutamate-5-semialdehyde dehydrogenase, partial [Pseudomonadota bacterium]|nr:glutamate-5-semialdehyde dehydrogenase [Pseudomonadota bacterium]
ETANQKDREHGRQTGLTNAFIDRLTLTADRIEAMATGLEDIARLDDPLGVELARWTRPNGLDIARISTALGVIGVIYESRPNVTVDAAGLCIKSGNAVILRGGSDSYHTSQMLSGLMQQGLSHAGLPQAAIQSVPSPDRALVGAMLAASGQLDVIIPRGGKGLVGRVQDEARVPVFAHLEGICHLYVSAQADMKKAADICINAKMRRVGICGAAETLLMDRTISSKDMSMIVKQLLDSGCEVRGTDIIAACDNRIVPASDADWGCEFLAPIIAVKTVSGLDDAIAHIRLNGSGHTESIITEDMDEAETFLNEIDSAIVMVNASTQFADGGEFGMGAEIGIATGRLHARGPVGAAQLTSFKYAVRGSGQTRA